jgi:hypothetical protein
MGDFAPTENTNMGPKTLSRYEDRSRARKVARSVYDACLSRTVRDLMPESVPALRDAVAFAFQGRWESTSVGSGDTLDTELRQVMQADRALPPGRREAFKRYLVSENLAYCAEFWRKDEAIAGLRVADMAENMNAAWACHLSRWDGPPSEMLSYVIPGITGVWTDRVWAKAAQRVVWLARSMLPAYMFQRGGENRSPFASRDSDSYRVPPEAALVWNLRSLDEARKAQAGEGFRRAYMAALADTGLGAGGDILTLRVPHVPKAESVAAAWTQSVDALKCVIAGAAAMLDALRMPEEFEQSIDSRNDEAIHERAYLLIPHAVRA